MSSRRRGTAHGATTSATTTSPQPVPVSSGTDAAGQPWKIEVAIATFARPAPDRLAMGFGRIRNCRRRTRRRSRSVVDDHRTYVLAELPRAIAATAQLQITRDGLDPVLVPFVDVVRRPRSDGRRIRVQRAGHVHRADHRRRWCRARRTGRRHEDRRATPEIIEIIDDDIDVFGDRPANTHDATTPAVRVGSVRSPPSRSSPSSATASPRRRRRSSVPKVAPAPSTSVHAPTTTVPAPTTTGCPNPLVPFYAADVAAAELTIEYAETQEPDRQLLERPGQYQLWATKDASAVSQDRGSPLETYPVGCLHRRLRSMPTGSSPERGPIAISHLPGRTRVSAVRVERHRRPSR